MTTSWKNYRMSRQEFDDMMPELDEKQRDLLWSVFSADNEYEDHIAEYWCECSMCGVEMSHRACGMCVRCEQVWNG